MWQLVRRIVVRWPISLIGACALWVVRSAGPVGVEPGWLLVPLRLLLMPMVAVLDLLAMARLDAPWPLALAVAWLPYPILDLALQRVRKAVARSASPVVTDKRG